MPTDAARMSDMASMLTFVASPIRILKRGLSILDL
jgi:hypothetical protein